MKVKKFVLNFTKKLVELYFSRFLFSWFWICYFSS